MCFLTFTIFCEITSLHFQPVEVLRCLEQTQIRRMLLLQNVLHHFSGNGGKRERCAVCVHACSLVLKDPRAGETSSSQ